MSGLDSIALAVAHLEERQKDSNPAILSRNSSDASSSNNPPSLAASSMTAGTATPPPPRALHVPPARVISVEESGATVVSNSTNTVASSNPNNSSPNSSPNSSNSSPNSRAFGYILADPIKWLQKTQDRPPLQPPTDSIQKVEPTDVLCGRGGETNHHPGNVQYRLLVKAFQPLYVSAKRRDKPLIAQCIVYSVRQVGGRFLKRANDKEWKDVGNTKAREKTSQALREGAPELRGDAGTPKMDKQQQQQQQPTMMPSSSAAAAPTPPPQPSMPPAPSHHHQGHGGQPMSFAEARFLSALLAQQAALTRSVVAGQHPHQHPHYPHAHHPAHGMGHPPMAPAPGGMMPQHAQDYQQQREYQHPQAPQQHPLPPSHQAQVPPSTTTTTQEEEEEDNSRKRPAVVSDGQSDSDSIGSNDVPQKRGGPRLKRFKMRLQETKSAA